MTRQAHAARVRDRREPRGRSGAARRSADRRVAGGRSIRPQPARAIPTVTSARGRWRRSRRSSAPSCAGRDVAQAAGRCGRAACRDSRRAARNGTGRRARDRPRAGVDRRRRATRAARRPTGSRRSLRALDDALLRVQHAGEPARRRRRGLRRRAMGRGRARRAARAGRVAGLPGAHFTVRCEDLAARRDVLVRNDARMLHALAWRGTEVGTLGRALAARSSRRDLRRVTSRAAIHGSASPAACTWCRR